MVTRAIKQVAGYATAALFGLAIIEEMQSDYIRFRAVGINTIDAAMVIAQRITEETGVQVTVTI